MQQPEGRNWPVCAASAKTRRWSVAAVCLAVTVLSGDETTSQERWRGIVVAPEVRCSEYDSDDYRYPQSVELEVIERQQGLYSPYTNEWFGSRGESDIEHVVARSEAHDSGLCARDRETRTRFAEDVENLTLAAPGLNRREKRGLDAAEWQPARNRCWFASTVLHVRRKYELTVDRDEAIALERMLQTCP